MEVKIWMNELEQEVTFSAELIDVTGMNNFKVFSWLPKSYFKNATITIDNLQWDESMYSKEENAIIEKYLPAAETELFEVARQELLDALEV